jgi:hypothetical protein
MAQPIQDMTSAARFHTMQAAVGNGGMSSENAPVGANGLAETGLTSNPGSTAAAQMLSRNNMRSQSAMQNLSTAEVGGANKMNEAMRGEMNVESDAANKANQLKDAALSTILMAGNMPRSNIEAMANEQLANNAFAALAAQGNIKRSMGLG